MSLLVPTNSSTLVVNRTNHWKVHWTIFMETGTSNTLSTVNLIWKFPFRDVKKSVLGQKRFWTTIFFFKLCLNFTRSVNQWKTFCCRNRKLLIEYIAGNTCFLIRNWVLTVCCCGTWHLIFIQKDLIHKKNLFTDQSRIKYDISLAGEQWTLLFDPFSANKSSTISLKRMDNWNAQWTFFLWKRVVQIRYRRQSWYETFRLGTW